MVRDQDQIFRNSAIDNFDSQDINKIKQIRRYELRELDFNLSHLQPTVRSRLLKLLFEFSDIFRNKFYTIGRTNTIKQIQSRMVVQIQLSRFLTYLIG